LKDNEPFFTSLGKPLPIPLVLTFPDTDACKSTWEESAFYPYELTANLNRSSRRYIFPVKISAYGIKLASPCSSRLNS
jgi:hypothetical protein